MVAPLPFNRAKYTRAVADDARSASASCVETEDLPTPPLPEHTMMMFFTDRRRRATGVSSALLMMLACYLLTAFE